MYVNHAPSAKSATELRPEHSPSTPSIRLYALIINTIATTTKSPVIIGFISCIPKSPNSVVGTSPVNAISVAEMICTKNLVLYETPTKSSVSPIKNIINEADSRNINSVIKLTSEIIGIGCCR